MRKNQYRLASGKTERYNKPLLCKAIIQLKQIYNGHLFKKVCVKKKHNFCSTNIFKFACIIITLNHFVSVMTVSFRGKGMMFNNKIAR